MRKPNAIIVGADQRARGSLRDFLTEQCGLGNVSLVEDGRGGMNYLRQSRFDLVVVDRETLGSSEKSLVRAASRPEGRIPMVIVTLLRKLAEFVRQWVDARRDGAEANLPDTDNPALGQLVAYARERGDLAVDPADETAPEPAGSQAHRDPADLYEIMGRSDAVDELVRQVDEVAETDYSVMLVGETGVGKEVVARALHRTSRRADGELVSVDCGAISESLAESELFGHVEGAFTGADRWRPGKFRKADGGTLFLDEISTMSSTVQGTLLRVLEQNSFHPVGSSQKVQVDTRILAASNRSVRRLEEFRDDLYYRLAEYVIEVPPLRERREDIPHLARQFLRGAAEQVSGTQSFELSGEAARRLKNHDWPGNVRELRNTVRRAALRVDARVVEADDIELASKRVGPSEPEGSADGPLADGSELGDDVSLSEVVQGQKEKVERRVIEQMMERTGGNIAEAARRLNADYKTVYNKVRDYGIDADDE
jgi:two-component system nitrogen regulation response regulator GlnG